MKKIVFSLVLAFASVISLGDSFGDVKIGTVDLMLLVRNHPDYERNKTLIESTDKDYQGKVDEIKAEGDKLQNDGKKLMDQYRNPMLNDKAKAEIEKQLTELQQKLIGIEQRYRSEMVRTRQELQDLQARLLKATTEDLRKRIEKFAEAKGYDFILDKNAAPYSKAAFEVTDELLKELGVEPSKAKGRNESK